LRAIAIILVLLRHAVYFVEQPFNSTFWNLWYNGWLGVDLFFALSGFLITHHLLTKWPEHNIKPFIYKYLSKRALRILPLYICVIALAALEIIPCFQADFPLNAYNLLVHTIFMQDYLPYSTILVPLWSLGVEEKFYLVAPGLVYLIYKYSPNRLLVACCLLILSIVLIRTYALSVETTLTYSEFFWSYRAPFHFSVTGILSGSVVALLYTAYPQFFLLPRFSKILLYVSTIFLLIILISARWLETGSWVIVNILIVLSGVLFAMLIYCSLYTPTLKDNRINKAFRTVSKLAYPLYLVHLLVLPFALNITNRLTSAFLEPFSFSLFFVVYIGLSFTLALVLHLLVEKPFLLLKERI
jgi:peptidoglycan/LPS O-acetylase OafA/YrhL